MSDSTTSPRLSIRLSPELRRRLTDSVAWGMQERLFRKLAEQVIELVERHGPEVIYLFIRGDLSLQIAPTEEPNAGVHKLRGNRAKRQKGEN